MRARGADEDRQAVCDGVRLGKGLRGYLQVVRLPSRKVNGGDVDREDRAGGELYAKLPPALSVLFIAASNLVRHRRWGCDRRRYFLTLATFGRPEVPLLPRVHTDSVPSRSRERPVSGSVGHPPQVAPRETTSMRVPGRAAISHDWNIPFPTTRRRRLQLVGQRLGALRYARECLAVVFGLVQCGLLQAERSASLTATRWAWSAWKSRRVKDIIFEG